MAHNKYFPTLFSPANIGKVRFKNRIVMLPMGTSYAGINGEVTGRTIDHFAERAKGGTGLITVGNVSINGRIALNQLVLDSDWFMLGHYELAEAVHAHGAKICCQLNHPGRQQYPVSLEGKQPVSSSAIQSHYYTGEVFPMPRALEKAEIYQIIEKYAAAALRVKKAGYDMVELHGANGYLITQFVSPFMNKRTDEFGGSLENRLRFPLEILKRVKEVVGNDFPVGMRFSVEEFAKGGITIKDSPEIIRRLAAGGLDYISPSAGIYETMDFAHDTIDKEEGWKTNLWEATKKAANIPVIAGGSLKTPAFCEKLLVKGTMDFIGLARPLLADPHWANKAREGRVDDIRLCISCYECQMGSAAGRQGARRCTVNAEAGREREFNEAKPAEVKKKVMVVGGGPGGMEAARVAALRGHRVTLYEKAPELGGTLMVAAAPPGKTKILWVRDYLEKQLKKLKVKVVLNTEVTPELVEKVSPDVIVLATGSRPTIPDTPGVRGKNVATASDVLSGKVKLGKKKSIAVIGGSMVGCETAEYLADKGSKVTVVKMRPGAAAADMQPAQRIILLEHLEKAKVPIVSNREVLEYTSEGVMTRDRTTGVKDFIKADFIVLAQGFKPARELEEALEEKDIELYSLGDCVEPRIIKEAVYEASMIGRRI
ncbi:MAG: FAD-dependent oxidoreductase [Chloroflexi bacterium]|nr:FAD-dependent oxidoreductase [Chloroflexota bacterium]